LRAPTSSSHRVAPDGPGGVSVSLMVADLAPPSLSRLADQWSDGKELLFGVVVVAVIAPLWWRGNRARWRPRVA
jgi:hypothetical protein